MNHQNHMVLFGGSACRKLAVHIASLLEQRLGRSFVEHFPDGEMNVRLDEPVRGRHVFVVQSTAPPVSDNLIELLGYADACRRSGAAGVTAVVPYFGYARSDKRHGRREPIMASMVAELMQAAGIGQVLTLDLHSAQVEGFFHIPVSSLTALPTLVAVVSPSLPPDTVIVSPDEGRVKVATEAGRMLRRPIAVLHKRREAGAGPQTVCVVGDVKERACLLIDDIIATGETIAGSVNALLQAGARSEIYVAATHAVFSAGARERLSKPAIRSITVTDSVREDHGVWPGLSVVGLASLFAAAIRRICENESLEDLYVRPVGVSVPARRKSPERKGEARYESAIP